MHFTRTKTAILITPLHSDPEFAAKRDLAARAAARKGWRLVTPRYDKNAPAFDCEAAKRELRQADLVIADLSRERPSCYFELGFAEALNKPIFIIAAVGTDIHQTGHRDRVQFFSSLDEYEHLITAALSNARQALPEIITA